jgi:hypothetical protein
VGKHYATCGHEVEFGVTIQVDEGQVDGYTYGTYCSNCLLDYWVTESIVNSEFNDFIEKVFDYKVQHDMNKLLYKIFREEYNLD